MITFLKFRNEYGGTLKSAPISIKFSGDDFFVVLNTFNNGALKTKSERAFDAV